MDVIFSHDSKRYRDRFTLCLIAHSDGINNGRDEVRPDICQMSCLSKRKKKGREGGGGVADRRSIAGVIKDKAFSSDFQLDISKVGFMWNVCDDDWLP